MPHEPPGQRDAGGAREHAEHPGRRQPGRLRRQRPDERAGQRDDDDAGRLDERVVLVGQRAVQQPQRRAEVDAVVVLDRARGQEAGPGDQEEPQRQREHGGGEDRQAGRRHRAQPAPEAGRRPRARRTRPRARVPPGHRAPRPSRDGQQAWWTLRWGKGTGRLEWPNLPFRPPRPGAPPQPADVRNSCSRHGARGSLSGGPPEPSAAAGDREDLDLGARREGALAGGDRPPGVGAGELADRARAAPGRAWPTGTPPAASGPA